MSISTPTEKAVKYYSLQDLNSEFSIKKLHKVLQAARDGRLISKYSQLIANNSQMLIYWYEKAHAEKVDDLLPIVLALIAIKADLQPEQSSFTVIDILNKKRTATNEHNIDLFYASLYHRIIFNLDAANYTYIASNIYSRCYQFFLWEIPLNYKDVDNVCAEIIDTEIISYVGKNPHDINAYFKARQKVLARDILYKNNYWRNINVVSHRLYKQYLIYEKRHTYYAETNFLYNHPWSIRRQPIARVYKLNSDSITTSFVVQTEIADSQQLISHAGKFSILLLRNIAMYGLNIPLSLIHKIAYLSSPRLNNTYYDDILRSIVILNFSLDIKLAYSLDYVQIYTLIYTGVLVDSFSGAKLSHNINLSWLEHTSLRRYDQNEPITLDGAGSKYWYIINKYYLYLPVYSRIAQNVMAYMNHQLSAPQLMSIYGINNYCLIKGNTIYSWSHTFIADMLYNLQLIWPIRDNSLQLNLYDLTALYRQHNYNPKNIFPQWINFPTKLINLLQYDNRILSQRFNIANIYNRIDILKIIAGEPNFYRLKSYQTGDGNIYDLKTKQELHFASPTEMGRYIISKISTHALDEAVVMLSIIDAYDLFNQPELWQKFINILQLSWYIVN